jgi:DNA-binding MarR family transcriptional regulator
MAIVRSGGRSRITIVELRKQNPCETLQWIADQVGVSKQRAHYVLKQEGQPTAKAVKRYLCNYCGKEVPKGNKLFCSMEHRKAFGERNRWVSLKCDRCGTIFRRAAKNVSRDLISEHQERFYCSYLCRVEDLPIGFRRGKLKARLEKQKTASLDRIWSRISPKKVDDRTFSLFIRTADAVLKYLDAVMNRVGLSPIKLTVLQLLQSHGGSLTPAEIADLTLREANNFSTLIKRLRRDQLISVKKNTKDRRSYIVSITDKGKQALIDTAPAARGVVNQIMDTIPDSSAATLESLLDRLRLNACDGLAKVRKPRD